MYLSVKGFALATGGLWGLALFVITLVAAGRGIGNNLSHISAIFIGYQVTYVGSVVGLVYGFVSGLIAGGLLAGVYNTFASRKT
jgi:cell shape-determining protein MreD